MKKVLYGLVIGGLLSLVVTPPVTISAESVGDVEDEIEAIEKEKKEIEEKQSGIESNKKDTEKKINENLNQQSSVKAEVNSIDRQLAETNNKITAKEKEIETTNQEIKSLEEEIKTLNNEIDELIEKIEKRDVLLKNRLRSIQQSGGEMNYMEVIFGAKSFDDFISRSISVTTIMDQDKEIMDQQIEDKKLLDANKKEVENKKGQVEDEKAALETQKEELVTLKGQLDDQLAEKESLMAKLEEEHAQLEEIALSYEEEQDILQSEAEAKQKALQLAQDKKSELEQLAKEKAEGQKQKEQEAANNNSGSSSSNDSSGNNVSSSLSQGNANGIFTMPANGTISSHFGMRFHPIFKVNRLHAGTDFAVGTGTTLVAPADGVVFRAGWIGGFGKAIMITHNINGQTYTTVSAHLSQINVSAGDAVSEGQVIGATGNTGNSTGPHLHFETHLGGYGNPVNSLPYFK